MVARSLKNNTEWSLGAALSDVATISRPPPEPVTTTETLPDGSKQQTVAQEPVDYSVLAGSASRLIAFFGMIVILIMFLGFGSIAMWRLGTTGILDDDTMTGVMKFLFGGVGLFVPYAFNQIQKCFSALGFTSSKP